MSLSNTELQQHCQTIIKSRRAQNKIVILCEGNIHPYVGRASPADYRQLERFPDANFYKACVPVWWQQKRPEFFICGDRQDVINTYFELQKMHEQLRDDSYLNKDKLFAIIDLDLPLCKFDDSYPVKDSEALFYSLYQQGKINQQAILEKSIFITGLIYKEAYFLIPDLQPVFDDYSPSVYFNNAPINLKEVYQEMGRKLVNDGNLKQPDQFLRACKRIRHCQQLNLNSLDDLQQSWSTAFNTANESTQHILIYALLAIHQVKDYWKALEPHEEPSIPAERFKEQLTLKIADFYARQARDSTHHISCFFNALSKWA
jgi:hypothetical protein